MTSFFRPTIVEYKVRSWTQENTQYTKHYIYTQVHSRHAEFLYRHAWTQVWQCVECAERQLEYEPRRAQAQEMKAMSTMMASRTRGCDEVVVAIASDTSGSPLAYIEK